MKGGLFLTTLDLDPRHDIPYIKDEMSRGMVLVLCGLSGDGLASRVRSMFGLERFAEIPITQCVIVEDVWFVAHQQNLDLEESKFFGDATSKVVATLRRAGVRNQATGSHTAVP